MQIVKADFAPYVDISTNIRQEKLTPVINEAIRVDLMGLMGFDFYNDFQVQTALNTIPQPYADLLNGATYEYTRNGTTLSTSFKGVKVVVIYYATARLIKTGDLAITQAGNRSKIGSDVSEPANYGLVAKQIAHYENLALAEWEYCKNFIRNSGKNVFPLFTEWCTCGFSNTQFKPKFFGV